MRHGHLIGAIWLAIVVFVVGTLTVGSQASSQGDATPEVPDAAPSASIAFESYDGGNRVSFTVYRLDDPTAAHLLYEALRPAGREPGEASLELEMSFPLVGEESVAYITRPGLTRPEGPEAVLYTRIAEFVFVFRTGGSDPVELMLWATGTLPFDPNDELDDAGTDDLSLLIPDLQEMPTGYVLISEDGTPIA